MAFQTIKNITIDGANKAFNGFVYNVDYDVSITADISKLTIHFISEDGTYVEPKLSVTAPYRIKIGDTVDENFYAVSYQEHRTGSQKTLEVTFYDGSIILDRLWIGLHKKHGTNPKAVAPIATINGYTPNPYPFAEYEVEGSADNIIIVGNEVHPCDINQDGRFDNHDLPLLVYDDVDVCDIRCANETVDINQIVSECFNKTRLHIFDVTYKFSELLDAISGKVKILNVPELPNDSYHASHFGTLRDVLRKWCGELGFNFYWENGGINIVDISERPVVTVPTFECVDSFSHGKTLEGTVSKGAITHYSQEGRLIEKTCPDGQIVALHCLTLRDLYTDFWKPIYTVGSTGQEDGVPDPAPNPTDVQYLDTIYPNGVPVENLEAACICAYYDQRLRDAYVLRSHYGLVDVPSAIALKKKQLDRFGSMFILKVYDHENTDRNTNIDIGGGSKSIYDQLTTSALSDKFFKTPAARKSFLTDHFGFRNQADKGKGFFMLVWMNKKKYQEQFQWEETLATQFIGRHWLRPYIQDFAGDEPSLTPGGQYIGASATDLKIAAFAGFNHSNNSRVQQLAAKLQIKLPMTNAGGVLENRREIFKDIKTLLYYERPNPVWDPVRETNDFFKTALDRISSTLPKICPNLDTDVMKKMLAAEIAAKTITDKDFEDGYITLMRIVPDTFTIATEFAYNPFEENPIYNPVAQFAMAKYGLTSKRCVSYNLWGVRVNMPAGASCQFNANYNPCALPAGRAADLSKPLNADAPTYNLVVTQSLKPHNEIPKVEAVFVSPAPDVNTLKIDYSVKSQVDDHTIRALNNLQKRCVPDMKTLQDANELFNKNLTYSITTPFESYEFTVPGIDLPSGAIKISTGLESLTIRVDEKGPFSTYKIGNHLYSPVEPDVLSQILEFKMNTRETKQSPFTNARPAIPTPVS